MELHSVRERLEAREEELSVHAVRSARSRGRKHPEPPSEVRTEFQRDRDRIIHTNSFRRLKHKSQVFVAPQGDHYVTRLTHVIEVAQIGRTIARALNLNEDLVEAAALGHDLGHTPFGHIGETVLAGFLPGGFHHSRHSVRIVETLEKDGQGLNLTGEVVEAIRHHSKPQGPFIDAASVSGLTLEAQIVRLSDALAYLMHDIGDALRSGFFQPPDLPPSTFEVLGETHGQRVNTLVLDVVRTSWECAGDADLHGRQPWVRMSDRVGETTTALRNFMFESFYLPISESREGRRAADVVLLLLEHYARNPDRIPEWLRQLSGSDEQAAADWVCGMTDNYALIRAEEVRPGVSEGLFQGRV
jgi:dGTPase